MDIEYILKKLEEFKLLRLSRIIGDYYQIYCPFHSNGEERRPSCGVLLHEQVKGGQIYPAGFCHCFTCGYAKTFLEFIQDLLKSKSITTSANDWLVENIPGYEPLDESQSLLPNTLIDTLNSTYAIDYLRSLTSPKVEYVSEEELASYRFVIPYMYERKLTDDIIAEYDIGFDANWVPPGRRNKVPCITFPVRDIQGRTLFLCRRSVEGKLYNYPTGVVKPVYGIDRVPQGCKSLIICESAINALTCRVYGYNAVALLGTGNSYQIKQLKELGVREFVLGMDGDDAGVRAAKKLKNQLKSVAMIWTMHLPKDKDINDLTKEEFLEVYGGRD